MSILNLISLLAGLALFLYGITLMGDGLNLVAGNKLEVFLYRLTSNRFRGILLGTTDTYYTLLTGNPTTGYDSVPVIGTFCRESSSPRMTNVCAMSSPMKRCPGRLSTFTHALL